MSHQEERKKENCMFEKKNENNQRRENKTKQAVKNKYYNT
jgi:hypothetical protein